MRARQNASIEAVISVMECMETFDELGMVEKVAVLAAVSTLLEGSASIVRAESVRVSSESAIRACRAAEESYRRARSRETVAPKHPDGPCAAWDGCEVCGRKSGA